MVLFAFKNRKIAFGQCEPLFSILPQIVEQECHLFSAVSFLPVFLSAIVFSPAIPASTLVWPEIQTDPHLHTKIQKYFMLVNYK